MLEHKRDMYIIILQVIEAPFIITGILLQPHKTERYTSYVNIIIIATITIQHRRVPNVHNLCYIQPHLLN